MIDRWKWFVYGIITVLCLFLIVRAAIDYDCGMRPISLRC